jgi:threonine dehydrogenase-like Zn-dependent dehydrogenase
MKRLFPILVKVEETNGANCRVTGLNYRSLHAALSQLPGAVFPTKPSFFWFGAGVYAEFTLQGSTFQIEADPFEDALWISTKDKLDHPEEIRTIREHLEKT